MTYKEIVDLLGNISDNHYMIADWGYGQLTDIKTRVEEGRNPNYPYMFINPVNGTRNGTVLQWTFNLIMMEVVGLEDDFLKTQSDCQQYLDDVLAHLHLYYQGPQWPNPVLNITFTPFKERFQDEVAGMTAIVQMEVPAPLNDCITPIA